MVLDANLNPTNTAFVFNLHGTLFGIEETLPYWFATSNFSWQVTSGQIILKLNASSVFVRQQEDDVLQSQTGLVDPTTTNRVSNDGYFRGAAPAESQLIVMADTNGVAQINVQLALNPPELRPHFPYAGRNAGAQIPTANGLLTISNSVIAASSYLNVTGAVPVSYGRDCTYAGCTAAQAGPATLNFTAASGQLGFTPDGGLLAYGAVPPGSLQWGYTPSGNFAQTAGSVSSGAYCMAGTFLGANQTVLDNSQRASVILFSGFGDASNPAYFERPGLVSYNDGFANYPGLNFRSPAQGFSYLAQTSVGPYPLNPVSKYYVRPGGVNGIHQAASFPASLSLYGYNFTFTDYGLSYLDGQNWQSAVTAGAISFPPQPAGFTQGFDRMKLTCRGDLSSANLPAGGGAQSTSLIGTWILRRRALIFIPPTMTTAAPRHAFSCWASKRNCRSSRKPCTPHSVSKPTAISSARRTTSPTWIRVSTCPRNFRCRDRAPRCSRSPQPTRVISTTGIRPVPRRWAPVSIIWKEK